MRTGALDLFLLRFAHDYLGICQLVSDTDFLLALGVELLEVLRSLVEDWKTFDC